ncbi:hypothetical protein [Nocardioides sp.]|uniref:hypothetical protein n=1 Tax=Nocardioides sp. TaxID=35761 RepID=UPI0037832A41
MSPAALIQVALFAFVLLAPAGMVTVLVAGMTRQTARAAAETRDLPVAPVGVSR